jgi:hypothetical protein
VLPLLLHLIDLYLVTNTSNNADEYDNSSPTTNDSNPNGSATSSSTVNDLIVNKCTESLANLSINRKNRREIASSGLAARMATIFEHNNTISNANTLLVLGNLLSSNLFHDKVINKLTIENMLNKLFIINYIKQFNAISYCLCQLSKNINSSLLLIECNILDKILNCIHIAPADSIDYLWIILRNITSYKELYNIYIMNTTTIFRFIDVLYNEVLHHSSTPHILLSIMKISLNLTQHSDFTSYLDKEYLEKLILTCKYLFHHNNISSNNNTSATSNPLYIIFMSLISLINIARYSSASRSIILSNDLIDLYTYIGIENDYINVRYVELLHILSNDENCCYKLVEMNIQRFLMSLQDSFQRLVSGKVNSNSKYTTNDDSNNSNSTSTSTTNSSGNAANAISRPNTTSINSRKLLSSVTNSSTNTTIPNNINISINNITSQLSSIEEGELGKHIHIVYARSNYTVVHYATYSLYCNCII